MACIRTTCPYCGVGCGIVAQADGERLELRGDPQHPANLGRLCSKGSALAETLDLEGRLLYPSIRGQRVSWDTALDAAARGFSEVIERHGPQATAFYVSGQLLTEDYYVANKLMKGFIGTANIDTNSRLCMSSSVAGHKRAFGSDTVPGCYEDLEQAELIVLVGSNLAWCHPVLYQRIFQARKRHRARKLVVIDPRRTATCEDADLHLALAPGSDTVLFNGLLVYLHQHDRLDVDFLENHTRGYWSALKAAREVASDIPAVARRCQLDEAEVADFYRWFARFEKTVSVYSQGVNQSTYGSDKVNAIINCHLATGRIGKTGAGPFSVTGQPNAMGGREVGGLANQLAAHMDFESAAIDRVRRFWKAPNMATQPGLKAVDLFQAAAKGDIKALWIMATNPVVSMPDADAVKTALERCELVIISDACADTDTARYAHIRLPALTWGEKNGTVTNSERRISRQRSFLPAPGEAKPDWWIISQVAGRLGYGTAFAYDNPAQIFREHAALSAFENNGKRDFDIGALAALSDADYQRLQPLQWPLPANAATGAERLLGDGRFFTADRRGVFVAIGERAPANPVNDDFPLILNTGRVRDHWHTLTRTGKSPRLSSHIAEPYAEINPIDAVAYGIGDNELVRVFSRWGEAIVRARLSRDQRIGSVFVPMHWSERYARHGRIDAVVNPVTDPISGQPEAKYTPVAMRAYRPLWHGFIMTRSELSLGVESDYWTAIRGRGFWRYELGGDSVVEDWESWSRRLLKADGADLEWIDFRDSSAGRYRGAGLRDGGLVCCVFIAPDPFLPPRDWLAELFAFNTLPTPARVSLLSGRPGKNTRPAGRTVCACFGVGLNTLVKTIAEQDLATPEAVGAVLQAGTNCGSCLPELRAIIARARTDRAA